VVATFDVDDSVGPIYSDLFNSAKGGVERTLVITGTNSGLQFSLDLTNDALRGGRFINNRDYYFAVTAYSFDVNNTSTYFLGPNPIGTISEVLESGFRIVTGTPRGSNAVLTVEANHVRRRRELDAHQRRFRRHGSGGADEYERRFRLPDRSWVHAARDLCDETRVDLPALGVRGFAGPRWRG
jgi:hypothetical protein